MLSMLAVLALWFGISVPLVFLGAYYGYKKDPLEFPVVTSNIPRQIPEQPWYASFFDDSMIR
jgi:transmembrane 9 superfamily member 2/4